ncbi:MAG TPA: DUF4157 domain-containing protein [Hanamia sp.]|nr:DUF4157 domain-containing protein [Hanamia sp.]
MKAAQLTPAATPAKKNSPFFSKGGKQDFFHSSIKELPFFSKTKNNNYGIQTKLTIGAPNDVYEKEADAMADKVVQRLAQPEVISKKDQSVQAKPLSTSFTPLVQKKCAHCEEEEKLQKEKEHKGKERIQKKPIFESDAEPPDDDKKVQRKCAECEKEEKLQKKSNESSPASPSNIESCLSSSKGGGSTLPAATLEQMEGSFGADFSNVRIHNDSSAVQMSRDLNAQAFTHGGDIYFNSGKYDPNSRGGKHLLAHELTHVVQQNSKSIQRANEENSQKQPFLNQNKNTVQRFNIPFTDYETDFSWSGVKTAAGLTADAAKATGKWVYNRGKFIVGNAVGCAKATGNSIGKLVTGEFDSLADLLGMPKPGEDGPSMTDWITFVITHPCLKMIPGYEAVEYIVDKFSGISKFLKGAWHMAKNPDETIEAIHTSSFLTDMIGRISPATLSIAMKAVTFSTPSAEIVKGIYRHLTPKLDYLSNNWWEVLKSAAWDLIWPWPGVGKDLGIIWHQLGECVDNLWDLNISDAADNLLTVWGTVNSMLGRLYGWFLIASVLIGAIIGAFFGGAGAIPGAMLGFEFAMAAGKGLLVSTIGAETAIIGKAGLDLVFKSLSPEEKENNFEKIANSGITLAITGIMVALGELAVRFAKGLINKLSGLFISAEEGAAASTGGVGKGGGTSGGEGGGQSWTPKVIQGGKGAGAGTGPVAQAGGPSGGTIGNTAVKIEPAAIIEPPPEPNLKLVPDLPPAVKTPGLPSNTGPVVGGLAGAEAAKKLKQKANEGQKKKKICYRSSVILRIEGQTFVPITVSPTPDDLRIPACILRTLTGTTDNDFTFRNIAVGRFIVNGNPEYVAAPNPEGNIHSEDEVLRLAEQRFGRGKFIFDALFTERRPCDRCTGNIFRFPRTPGFLAYCIINNDYNWRQIREAYNEGRLI